MKRRNFRPKKSVKLPAGVLHGSLAIVEENERLKLLEELHEDPVKFLNTYFTVEQAESIKSEIINDWDLDRRL